MLRPLAEKAVPALCSLTKDADKEVRRAAEFALIRVAPAEADKRGIE